MMAWIFPRTHHEYRRVDDDAFQWSDAIHHPRDSGGSCLRLLAFRLRGSDGQIGEGAERLPYCHHQNQFSLFYGSV